MAIKRLTKTNPKSVTTKNEGLTRLASAFVGATAHRFANLYGVDYLFSLGEEPVYPADLADPDCLFPVIAWHANSLHKQAFGFPMGVLLLDNKNAMLSKRVDFDGSSINTSTVLLFAMEALFDMRDNLALCNKVPNAIALDAMVSSFHREMRKRKTVIQNALNESQPLEASYANP